MRRARTIFVLACAAVACSKSSAPSSEVTTSANVIDASVATASSSAASASPYNVLFITLDSMRADMPWAGYPRAIAPNLTALAARSTVYTHAYSISSYTSKSVAGLLTGKYPSELARTGVFFTKYDASNSFMCESLEKQAIPCVSAQGHAYLKPGYAGLDQGFHSWKVVDGITLDYQRDPYVTSQKLTPLAISLLQDPEVTAPLADGGTHPFFAWFHYMDPHDDYQSHEESPHFGTHARDLYDEEIFYADLWIGKLLEFANAQPWSKNTVIVVSADHGEFFGEHGRLKHAHELYEELIHVPLLVHLPNQDSHREIDVPRSQIDLVPTFFDMMNATPTPDLDGVSLKDEWQGKTPASARDIIADMPQDEFDSRRRAFIHDGWKIIAHRNDEGFELFHLAEDPGEQNDLMMKDKENSKRMLALYRAASASIKDVAPTGGVPGQDE